MKSHCHGEKIVKVYGEKTCSYCLQECKIKKPALFPILVVLMLLSLLGCSHKIHHPKKYYDFSPYMKISDTIQFKDVALNDDSIAVFLIQNNCILPGVAVKQFHIESANYTSKICVENKNIAGIKYNKHGYCIGENRGHAVYSTYKDCILDYIRIQNRFLKNIDGVYAESPDYLALLKK